MGSQVLCDSPRNSLSEAEGVALSPPAPVDAAPAAPVAAAPDEAVPERARSDSDTGMKNRKAREISRQFSISPKSAAAEQDLSHEKFTRDVDETRLKTWQILYCGGAQPVVDTLSKVRRSARPKIPLGLTSHNRHRALRRCSVVCSKRICRNNNAPRRRPL